MLQTFDDGSTLQTFDDGSTLATDSFGGTYSTESAYWGSANNQGAIWTPGAVTAGAGSWDDVLRYGASRLIDAKVRQIQPQSTAPVSQPTAPRPTQVVNGVQLDPKLLLLIGGAVLFLVLAK